MRRDSCRSVPMMWSPPASMTRSCSAAVCAENCVLIPVPVGTGHPVEVVQVEEVDELRVVDELRLLLRQALGHLFGEGLLSRHELGVAPEQDVGAAPRHVGRDGHRPVSARLRDDLRLLGVIFRVQYDVFYAAALEQARQPLGLLDRDGAGEDGTAGLLILDDVLGDRVVFLALGAVDGVRLFEPEHARDWSG